MPLLAPELASSALTDSLLRLHGAATLRDFWYALRLLARETWPSNSQTLELGYGPDGIARKVYRHSHIYTPRELSRDHPDRSWLAAQPGVSAYRFSDLPFNAREADALFQERVMRREGWTRQLALLAWRGRERQATLSFFRDAGQPDFSARELRLAEAIQPHFQTALSRVLAAEEEGFLAGHFADLLENVPVGLLLLNFELRPLWHNGEAAHACSVWNHGERRAVALNPRRAFRVPAPLAKVCGELRDEWQQLPVSARRPTLGPRVLSEDGLGLHAKILLRAVGASPLLQPAFHVEVDYRRPRGDRNRQLPPGAVALLARLSGREREVAMRIREGLRTMEIATELKRSPLTIKTQTAAIFAKLGVRSRSRVAALLNR